MMLAASYWLIAGDIGLALAAVLFAVAAVVCFIIGLDDGLEWWGMALAFALLGVFAAAGATAVHAA